MMWISSWFTLILTLLKKTKPICFNLIGFLLIFSCCGWAQSPTVPVSSNIFFSQLSTKNGLSYNLINCLHQDRQGFIWIGTFNGLDRFDGTHFIPFKHNRTQSNSIAHNNIMDICEDKAGNIWVATVNGVSRYSKDSNTFTNYLLETNSSEAFSNNVVNNILCDRNGTIWATSLGGLFEFLPAKNRFKAYRHDPANPATLSSNLIHRNSLVEDPNHPRLWLGSGKGLNCFDLNKKVFYNYRNNPQHSTAFTDHRIYPLAFDRLGQLLFGDEHQRQLLAYNAKNNQTTAITPVLASNKQVELASISAIYIDPQNDIWLSSWNNEIFHRTSATNTWIQLQHDDADPGSINSNFFWDALQTREGVTFVGGLYGLSIYKPNNAYQTIFNPALAFPERKSPLRIFSLVEDDAGTVWMGTNWNGLIAYNVSKQTFTTHPVAGHATLPLSVSTVFHLAIVDDNIWVCTRNGIQIFNPVTQQYKPFTGIPAKEKLQESYVTWMFQDSRKTVWISASSRWLFEYHPQTKIYKRHNLDSLSGSSDVTNVTSFAEDKLGNVWFGTYLGRLYQYNSNQQTFTVHLPNQNQRPRVLQQPINDLWAGPDNKIWYASEGGGLVQYDPVRNRFKSWMESDGLLMDVCNRILPDRQGNLWVNSYEGHTIFDPVRERIVNPRVRYGQRENNFFSNTQYRLRNGDLLFVNTGNLIRVNPDKIGGAQAASKPVISSLAVFEKSRPLFSDTSPIELTYKENFFTLAFSSLAAPGSAPIEYTYRLTNYDPDWVRSENRTFATYTGVKGGHYLFQVRARTQQGNWSSVQSLPIYIQPPFWQTGWFQLGLFGTFIGLFIFIARNREKRLMLQQAEKSEFKERLAATEMKALRSQMNPHFLYNSLNAIRLFVLQNDSDNADKYLVKFSRLMRLILDNSRQEWVTLASELEQLQLYLELEQLRFDHKFEFVIETNPDLNKESLLIPPMIIQPYIENAILHGIAHKTETGTIWVRVRSTPDHLECVVEDDGIGRRRAAELKSRTPTSHRSVGLQVTAERLQLIGQRNGKQTGVTVIDKENEDHQATGTRVVIELPLMNA
ncbi:histidine kinase [Spirosoma sp. BT702]|uniref:Histidine kinase n=1 Tax=Spirosoma profusum TaxID=2771354 RepID=A0A927ATL0_9BACT|nr:two-component regulator propeller domain-containing protein [Spirosoma profusum]MBD2703785.1 histidine kinase [Spirosoma profusum]